MPQDALTDYSFERGEQIHSFGADVQIHFSFDVGDELIITANLAFGEGRCILSIYEVVQLTDGGEPHRRKYGYQVICGDTSFRYDRDPIHADMPEHKHLGDGRRVPWERVTLQDVVDEVLDLLSQRMDAEREELDKDDEP
jgi:hypothetical protein